MLFGPKITRTKTCEVIIVKCEELHGRCLGSLQSVRILHRRAKFKGFFGELFPQLRLAIKKNFRDCEMKSVSCAL